MTEAGDQTLTEVLGGRPGRSRQVKEFDFRQHESLDRNHLRALTAAFEAFALLAGSTMAANLRSPVKLQLASVEQHSWEDFASTSPDPAALTVFTLPPLPGKGVMVVSLDLAMAIIDHRLGGQGSDDYPARPLTEIEQSLILAVCELMLEQLPSGMASIMPVATGAFTAESNIQILQLVWPTEMCLVARFEFALSERHSFELSICLPFPTLRPLIEILKKAGSDDGPEVPALLLRLLGVPVDVSVQFKPALLSSADIVGLNPGDVVRLHHDREEPLGLVAGGVTLKKVTAAQRGKRIHCTVVEDHKEES